MAEYDRRRVLAAGAASVGVLSGCSSLPIVGDSGPDSELEFDPSSLSGSIAADLPAPPEPYPGPIPEGTVARHRRRARDLLDAVPEDPSFANGAFASRLADERADAVAEIDDGAESSRAVERLSDWHWLRAEAGSVRGTYDAARGDLDAAELARRRASIRTDLAAAEADWEYPGRDPVEALALSHRLEAFANDCREAITPDRAVPATPDGNEFAVGERAGRIERGRAALSDRTALAEAYRESADEPAGHREALSVLARRVDGIAAVTLDRLGSLLDESAEPDDLGPDVSGPGGDLFVEAKYTTERHRNELAEARSRRDPATAVVAGGRALVAGVALSTVVEAVTDGEYAMPESPAELRRHRQAAVSAVERARSVEPGRLADLLGAPVWSPLGTAAGIADGSGGGLDENGVGRLTELFGLATHLARAVPTVTHRLAAELPDDRG